MGTVATTETVEPKPKKKVPSRPCGFCSTGSHERCPGAVIQGNGLWFCPCGCPTSRLVRCKECGSTESADLTGWHCGDKLACEARTQARRETTPIYRFIQEMEKAKDMANKKNAAGGTSHRSYKNPADEPVKAAKPKPEPKDCDCGCDGKTKGGAYLPGHDARHVSQVAKAVADSKLTLEDALAVFADKPKLQDKLRKRLER